MQSMEDEMNRFEKEIGGQTQHSNAVVQGTTDFPRPLPPPPFFPPRMHFVPHQLHRLPPMPPRPPFPPHLRFPPRPPMSYSTEKPSSTSSSLEASDMKKSYESSPIVYSAPPVRNPNAPVHTVVPSTSKTTKAARESAASAESSGETTAAAEYAAHVKSGPTHLSRPAGPDKPSHEEIALAAAAAAAMANIKKKQPAKPRKIVRMGGGQVWEDTSLQEWEHDDFRIFCGDLGNDVTDEVLARSFGKFPSFLKARVIRDKRNNKTKGFGFVSFRDPQDFIRAMKEMNGKYVGSRPIKLRKSTWKDRNIECVKKKTKEKTRLGLK